MPILSAFIGVIGCLLAAVFTAMMTVPKSTALANLQTYSQSFGIAPRTGLFLSLLTLAVGAILLVVSRRNRNAPASAIIEANRITGSSIEDNYSARSA